MGFLSLVIIMCWPILLMAALVMALLDIAINVIITVLLGANGIFLILLLFLRTKWKATGRMEPEFINTYTGWQRYVLLGIKLILTWGTVWEALVTAGCALLLFLRPWTSII